MSSVKVLLTAECLAAKLRVLVKLLFGADREAWWHAASKKQKKQQQAAPVHNEFVDEEVRLTLQCCVPCHSRTKRMTSFLPHGTMESVSLLASLIYACPWSEKLQNWSNTKVSHQNHD